MQLLILLADNIKNERYPRIREAMKNVNHYNLLFTYAITLWIRLIQKKQKPSRSFSSQDQLFLNEKYSLIVIFELKFSSEIILQYLLRSLGIMQVLKNNLY